MELRRHESEPRGRDSFLAERRGAGLHLCRLSVFALAGELVVSADREARYVHAECERHHHSLQRRARPRRET